MKIDRLIGILSILLQKDVVTAPCLAEQFEVSRQTIVPIGVLPDKGPCKKVISKCLLRP